MFSIPPYAPCDLIFGKNGTDFIILNMRTSLPKNWVNGKVVDSYRLEENDMLSTIHTLNINESFANCGNGIILGSKFVMYVTIFAYLCRQCKFRNGVLLCTLLYPIVFLSSFLNSAKDLVFNTSPFSSQPRRACPTPYWR